MNKEQEIQQELLEILKKAKRCSCYDEDCEEVVDKTFCFIGATSTGIADGFCPYIHTSN